MPKYTKTQVEDFTNAQIIDNITKENTPEKLRNVLAYHRDMEKLASYVKFVNDFLGSQTVDDALTYLAGKNIPSWSDKDWPVEYFVFYSENLYRSNEAVSVGEDNPGLSSKWDQFGALTNSQIRDLLETLTSTNRLNKSAVRGSDFSLNRRGQGDVMDGNYKSGMTNILQGDFWIYEDTTSSGGTDDISEWDWVVALTDSPGDFDYGGSNWWVIRFSVISAGTNMTADAIREALKTLPVEDMLPLDNVMYDSTKTAKTKLDEKQQLVRHKRVVVTVETDTITINSMEISVINMAVNHLLYFGDLDTDSGFTKDFVWRHNGGNTEIQVNPDVIHEFDSGTIIDIQYYI